MQGCKGRFWREHRHRAEGFGDAWPIAGLRKLLHTMYADEKDLPILGDHTSNWQAFDIGDMRDLLAFAINPCGVQRLVNFASLWACPRRDSPSVDKGVKIIAAAFGTRTVARGEGNSFIKEKQFSVIVRGHHLSMAAFEVQFAANPSLVTPARCTELLHIIVQDAAISHQRATGRAEDNFASGKNAVLKRHKARLLGLALDCEGLLKLLCWNMPSIAIALPPYAKGQAVSGGDLKRMRAQVDRADFGLLTAIKTVGA